MQVNITKLIDEVQCSEIVCDVRGQTALCAQLGNPNRASNVAVMPQNRLANAMRVPTVTRVLMS